MTGHQKVVASTASEIKKRAGENLLPKIWSSQAADSNIEHNDLEKSLRRPHRLTPTKQMPVQNKIRWTTIRITLLHEEEESELDRNNWKK